ncbi:hypothetical protein BpHYR1_027933, partial [Brachionus plicatilis]
GDFNSQSYSLGSLNTQNQNGAILEDALLNLNFALINNCSPTFHLANRDYYEILDLYISSPNLLDKMYDFKVLYDWDMTSDHYPVQLKLNSNYISINQASLEKFSYDFKRAD